MYCLALAPRAMELGLSTRSNTDGAKRDLGGLELVLAGGVVFFILPGGQPTQKVRTTAVGGKKQLTLQRSSKPPN